MLLFSAGADGLPYVAFSLRWLMAPGWRRFRRIRQLVQIWFRWVLAPSFAVVGMYATSRGDPEISALMGVGLLGLLGVSRKLGLDVLECPKCGVSALVRDPTVDRRTGRDLMLGQRCMRCGSEAVCGPEGTREADGGPGPARCSGGRADRVSLGRTGIVEESYQRTGAARRVGERYQLRPYAKVMRAQRGVRARGAVQVATGPARG